MIKTFLATWAAMLLMGAPPYHRPIAFDGESSDPSEQRVTYTYRCPDGVITLEEVEIDDEYPKVIRLQYGRRAFGAGSRKRIDQALTQIRSLENVSTRCLTQGGVRMMLRGLTRDFKSQNKIIVLRIAKDGQISVS